jgi:predicted PurR-regulated permease PerM
VLKDNATRVFGSYLRSQLALAVIVGVAAAIGSAALGLPYALLIGVLAGLFELVPVVGSTLSAVPALLVALSMPFPKVLWVLLYFVILQQVEDHVLAPRMSGQAVGLHPLAAMFALLAGVQVAGVVGGLLAVPLAGLVWALLRGSLEPPQ